MTTKKSDTKAAKNRQVQVKKPRKTKPTLEQQIESVKQKIENLVTGDPRIRIKRMHLDIKRMELMELMKLRDSVKQKSLPEL